MNPKELPIYELRAELITALAKSNRIVIEAPTGSGKSTQIPQMVLDAGMAGAGEIVVLQPRRLAARLLAKRVAFERGEAPGGTVGWQVRMERCISSRTRIRYVTEGILLRQFLSDPMLRDTAVIIFDEFHERHLYGDITLARALYLQQNRPDLKIIVMSATLDTGPLRDYLAPCRELKSDGRMYPVDIRYAPKRVDFRQQPLWEAAADAFEQAIEGGAGGDVLVFMPGSYEIARTVEAIRARRCARGFAILPLHGELSPRDQDAAVGECDRRKVVVATNVAETSITIDGICTVIDSGLARMARYDPRRGIDTLLVERISQASANQRAGRAGRTAPGVCMRLWTEREQTARPAQELPEIVRHDLAEVVLTLKASGIEDIEHFRWLEPPDAVSLAGTLTLLTDLGALDSAGQLTETGRRMSSFPMHPRYARMLLAGETYGCVRQACLIAALVQGRNVLDRKTDGKMRDERDELLGEEDVSDFKRLMRAWDFADHSNYSVDACRRVGVHAGAARQVQPLYQRFLAIARNEQLTVNERAPSDENLQKCILLAFSDHVARRRDVGTMHCEVVHGRVGDLDRNSVVRRSALFVAAEICEVEGRDLNVRLSLCTAICESWLAELFPNDMEQQTVTVFDAGLKRVVTRQSTAFRGLELQASIRQEADPQQAAELMAEEVIAGRMEFHQWNDAVERWIARANCLALGCPDLGIPEIDVAARRALVQELCLGAVCRRDLKDRPVMKVVKAWLSPAQQAMVEKQVPERIRLLSGTMAVARYEAGQPPVLSATIQQLYGMNEVPKIGFGRIPVTVEVLAPNRRPQQKTQDMRSFWQTTYPLLKKELKGRYPKHEWR